MAAAEQRIDVFVSYSHVDAAWLKRVQVHLKPLVRDEQIDLWDDTRIQAGVLWREEIRAALARARVAVLLISADFFASDFIATGELPPLLEAERGRGLVILGVHIGPSRFDRDGVLSEYQTVNPPGRSIKSLSEAEQDGVFDDLARRIEQLMDSSTRRVPPVTGAGTASPLPPKPPRCIGREHEVETLVGALLAGEPTPVLGPAGIGKSTVCLQALHDRRIGERFDGRRYFVRLDGASTAKDMLAGVAKVLGIPADQASIANVAGHFAGQPATLALDNLETPWEAETPETEALLSELAAVLGLSLAVTLRSGNRPDGVAWRDAIEVEPLSREDAKRVFLAVAGNKHAADARLADLLAALDGVPLAIKLMAHAAEAEPDLAGISQRWQTEHTEMLKRGAGDDRLINIGASLELSTKSARMTEPARRLLSLLGLLPDGIAHQELDTLLPGLGYAAAGTLRQVALAFDEAGCLRALAPVREHVAAHHAPAPEDLAHAIDHYAGLAKKLGPKCGREGGAEAVARLSAETANLESMLLLGLKRPEPRSVVEAAIGFAEFQWLSGLGTVQPVDQAVLTSKSINDALAARTAFWRGELALARSDHDGARECFEAALPLYHRVGAVLGEANCIFRLGDIGLARSDHDGARAQYEAALPLYHRVGDVLGEANCIFRLGDIGLARSDHDGARAQYEAALPLLRRVGSVLGEASCIYRLGEIALERSDHDGARERYEAALSLYSHVGDVLGEANCIAGLGDIARKRSDHDGARERYEAALPLYRRVGDVLGEANCIQSLGHIAFRRSDHDGARELFDEALRLYSRIREPYSIGWAHERLADVGRDEGERARHIAAAREAWLSIGREDLVQQLDESAGSATYVGPRERPGFARGSGDRSTRT